MRVLRESYGLFVAAYSTKNERQRIWLTVEMRGFARSVYRALFVALALVLLAPKTCALADDWPNSPPDGWWWYPSVTKDQLTSLLNSNHARLISVQVDQASPLKFTVAMVRNTTGAYAKQWWFYPDLTQADVKTRATQLNARPVSLDAYELNGKIFYAVVYISNTGSDRKNWDWRPGLAATDIQPLLQQNKFRLIDLRQYLASSSLPNPSLRYVIVWVDNTGADATTFWWNTDIDADHLSSFLKDNDAYVVSLQIADSNRPTFNVIMYKHPAPGGMGAWWYSGKNSTELTALYTQNGAWLRDVKAYQLNGQQVFTAVMMSSETLDEWYTYRYNVLRTGTQPYATALSDPAKASNLKNKWQFPPDGQSTINGSAIGAFASPIVVNDTVFAGNDNGYFYAIDASSGAPSGVPKWQYPNSKCPHPALLPLRGHLRGIVSSAAFWNHGPNGVVIFGAQDPNLPDPQGKKLFSARLFALDAKTGCPIWTTNGSDLIADINDSTPCDANSLYQSIHYSPILVLGDKAYVGIQSDAETPIQVGSIVAVDLNTGHIDHTFGFRAVGLVDIGGGIWMPGIGGGIWNALATDASGLYFTTGNVNQSGCPNIKNLNSPYPNYGLSMLRVDPTSGKPVWTFQAVPYSLDDDADWAAGATVMLTSCGELIASVQKDGWSYAIGAGDGTPGAPNVRWQFPPTGYPFGPTTLSHPIPPYTHGPDGYRAPGAAWGDVFIVTTGGEARDRSDEESFPGAWAKVQAVNACAETEYNRVRWIADLSPFVDTSTQNLDGDAWIGPPSVTGGIVYIGTNNGYLVVIADPSVSPPTDYICSNVDYSLADCANHKFNPKTPIPKVLFHWKAPDNGKLFGVGYLRTEPVLARGRVFVGTNKGHIYMLEPEP